MPRSAHVRRGRATTRLIGPSNGSYDRPMHDRRHGQELRNPLVRALLVLTARAEPDVRLRELSQALGTISAMFSGRFVSSSQSSIGVCAINSHNRGRSRWRVPAC